MAQYGTTAWTLAVAVVVLLAVYVREGQAAGAQLKPPVRLVADRQLQALQDFFTSTDGYNWVNNTGWASGNGDPCGRQAGNKPWYRTSPVHMAHARLLTFSSLSLSLSST